MDDYDYSDYMTETSLDNTGLSSDAVDAITGAGIVAVTLLVVFTIVLLTLTIIGQWKIFAKAGKKGWESLVPVHSLFVWLEVIGRPTWWMALYWPTMILLYIPFINILVLIALLVFWFIINIELAMSFGRGVGFGIFTTFFPYIGMPILGFGKAEYKGPVATKK